MMPIRAYSQTGPSLSGLVSGYLEGCLCQEQMKIVRWVILVGGYADQGSCKKYSQNHSALNEGTYLWIDLTMNINKNRLYQVNGRNSLYQVSCFSQLPSSVTIHEFYVDQGDCKKGLQDHSPLYEGNYLYIDPATCKYNNHLHQARERNSLYQA